MPFVEIPANSIYTRNIKVPRIPPVDVNRIFRPRAAAAAGPAKKVAFVPN